MPRSQPQVYVNAETRRRLKIQAAIEGISIIKLLDKIVYHYVEQESMRRPHAY